MVCHGTQNVHVTVSCHISRGELSAYLRPCLEFRSTHTKDIFAINRMDALACSSRSRGDLIAFSGPARVNSRHNCKHTRWNARAILWFWEADNEDCASFGHLVEISEQFKSDSDWCAKCKSPVSNHLWSWLFPDRCRLFRGLKR